ncbi:MULTISPECIES: hypothetical protein [unclassified Flavobacterium]|uniref:hypothetical protein n=1 Tax=unclassified Flavobacterium TaxID=196869 RepID=UPI001F131A1C|nr:MULTISPECIES: hypothetical protein [unclassified Flavobacterium]UMY64675.1 hypothetical protein MKO97_09135 [Flavobacterium sp. HJ-32-4]
MAPSTTYDIYIMKVCDLDSEGDPYVLSEVKTNASNCTDTVSMSISQGSPTALSLGFYYGYFDNPDHFELEYGLEGFTQGTGTSVSIEGYSSTTIGLSDLQAGARYDLYFRAVCSGLDGTPWKKVPYTLGVNCQEPIDLNSILVSGSCSTGVGATRMFSWSYPYSNVYNYSVSLVSADNIGNPGAGQIFTTSEQSISISGLDCGPSAFFVRANRYGNQTGSAWAGPFYF